MTTGPNAPAFKNHKLNQHHQHLKTIVTPLLPYDPNRKKSDLTNEALYDLFAVVNAAWELSSKMMMSRFTFSFDWAQGHDRFSAETHDAIACDIHPTILQRDHWLVKLGVTPIITARSDAGLSIATRTILKSGVLVTRMWLPSKRSYSSLPTLLSSYALGCVHGLRLSGLFHFSYSLLFRWWWLRRFSAQKACVLAMPKNAQKKKKKTLEKPEKLLKYKKKTKSEECVCA